MLDMLLGQLEQLPGYLTALYGLYRIPMIAMGVYYLIILIFSGHFPYVLRWIYVLASIGGLIYGYLTANYVLMWAVGLLLLFLMLFRLIVHAIHSIRQRRKDAKLERKALEKAAKRRGSFQNKQAYSGSQRPKTMEDIPKMSREEIEEVVTTLSAMEHKEELPLDDLLDDVPKNPVDEIEATKGELHFAAQTAKFDTEAIEEALRKIEAEKADQ